MRVVLLRHAQASVLGPDYDQLSSQGYAQAVLLGKHLRTMPWHPSVVCVGPKLRHRQTWETIALQGNTCPSVSHHEALDELPAEWIMASALPVLAREGHPVMSEVQELVSGNLSVEAIQKIMAAAMTLWMAGDLQEEGVETWPDFRRRVHQTLEGLAVHARAQGPAVAVTSAGFIGTALGLLQGHGVAQTLENIWLVPNGSLTTLEREASHMNWHIVQHPTDSYLPEKERTMI